MRAHVARFTAVIVLLFSTGAFVAQEQGHAAAIPLAPIDAVLDQFRSHHIVALGEGRHTNEQAHAFRLALIRDPRFAATVNDIVVEFGNSRYQGEMDRFMRGEEVSDAVLRHVWQDTTQPTPIWDVPIYEEFFRAVRAVNIGKAASRQLRVLLSDPPIDWSRITSRDDMRKWLEDRDVSDRDRYSAQLVQREVLAKGRRALVVYGDMHLQRHNLLTNFDDTDENGHTLVSLLERIEPVFTVWTNTDVDVARVQPSISWWPKPTLALLRDTEMGARDFTFYYPQNGPRLKLRDGKPVIIPREEWQSLRMQDQFDALMYLGSPESITTSKLPATICSDPNYLPMRVARLALGPPAPPGAPDPADRLKTLCGAATR